MNLLLGWFRKRKLLLSTVQGQHIADFEAVTWGYLFRFLCCPCDGRLCEEGIFNRWDTRQTARVEISHSISTKPSQSNLEQITAAENTSAECVCVCCLEIERCVCWAHGALPPSATIYCMSARRCVASVHLKCERHPSARLPSYLKTHHAHTVSPVDNVIRSPITLACINCRWSQNDLLDKLMLCSSPCWALSQRIDDAKPSLKISGQHLGDQTHNLKAALGRFVCLMFYLWLCKDPRRTRNLHRKILQHQRFFLLLQRKFQLIQEGVTGSKRHEYMFQYFESWMSLAADVQQASRQFAYLKIFDLIISCAKKLSVSDSVCSIYEGSRAILTADHQNPPCLTACVGQQPWCVATRLQLWSRHQNVLQCKKWKMYKYRLYTMMPSVRSLADCDKPQWASVSGQWVGYTRVSKLVPLVSWDKAQGSKSNGNLCTSTCQLKEK